MSVEDIVESAIKDNQVVIFSKTTCSFSARTKALFQAEFPDIVPYVVELNEREDGSDIQQYLHKKTHQRTVPNVFINKQHIGGNDDVQASFRAGKLSELIAST